MRGSSLLLDFVPTKKYRCHGNMERGFSCATTAGRNLEQTDTRLALPITRTKKV